MNGLACARGLVTLGVLFSLLVGCSGGGGSGGGQSGGGTVVTTVSANLPANGGQVILPNTAILTVPSGETTGATIQVSNMTVPIMDALVTNDLPNHTLLPVPRIRIKSSVPFKSGVFLTIQVPNLATLVPQNSRVTVVAYVQQQGAQGEVIDSLVSMGGAICGKRDAVCVHLTPDIFMPINPLDPLDPVAFVSVASVPIQSTGKYHLYTVNNVSPKQPLTTSADVTFQATVTFDQTSNNILPLQFPLPADQGIVDENGVPVGAFGDSRANPKPHQHKGTDLRTRDANGTPTSYPVVAAMNGFATPMGGSNDCRGYFVVIQDDNLKTNYYHLVSSGRYSGMTVQGTQIGMSDSSSCPQHPITAHLHFELLLDEKPLDPYPLLRNNLLAYLPYLLRLQVLSANNPANLDAAPVYALGPYNFTSMPVPTATLQSYVPQAGETAEIHLDICGGHFGLGDGCKTIASWNISNVGFSGTITTTGTSSSFGIHGSEPAPFTCYWSQKNTWTGTVDLTASNPVGHWDITQVATFTSSDSPKGVKCGGFTVGPYHADFGLQINGNQVTAGPGTSGGGFTFNFNATVTDTLLNGNLSTHNSGIDINGGQFQFQETGTFSLPRVSVKQN